MSLWAVRMSCVLLDHRVLSVVEPEREFGHGRLAENDHSHLFEPPYDACVFGWTPVDERSGPARRLQSSAVDVVLDHDGNTMQRSGNASRRQLMVKGFRPLPDLGVDGHHRVEDRSLAIPGLDARQAFVDS